MTQATGFLAFLDKPFILAISSGIILALVSYFFQYLDKKKNIQVARFEKLQDKKFELFEEFGNTFKANVTSRLNYMMFLIFIAEEKKLEHPDAAKISERKTRKETAFQSYLEASPIDVDLHKIKVLFPSRVIQQSIIEFEKAWHQFDQLVQDITTDYNLDEDIKAENIAEYKARKDQVKRDLEIRNSSLLMEMSRDLTQEKHA